MGSHAFLTHSVHCLLTGSIVVAAVLGSCSKKRWPACLQGSLILCLEGDQEAFVAPLQSLRLLWMSQYDAIQSQNERLVWGLYMLPAFLHYCVAAYLHATHGLVVAQLLKSASCFVQMHVTITCCH